MISPNETARQANEALRARRVPHGAFMAALNRGKELLALRDLGMAGSGFIVYGEAGVGKTALTDALVDYGTKHYGPDSVLRTQLPTGATIKSVISGLLEAIGDARPTSGDTAAQVKRLKSALVARKCRLIEIDETNHLMPGGNPSRTLIDNILNALKILDETGVSFILAGTDDITKLWTADKQIRSRFQVMFELKSLRYPEDRPAWRGIVAKFIQTLNQFDIMVDCPDLEDRLHAACNGSLRPLVQILTTAVVAACGRNPRVITSKDLDKATRTQVDQLDGRFDAFDLDLAEVQRHSRSCHASRVLAPAPRGLNDILRQ